MTTSRAYQAGYAHMTAKLAGLAGALPTLGGAAIGAAGGAFVAPEEDRLRGAMLGAATGGLAGGLGHMARGPAPSGDEVLHGFRSALTGGMVGSAVGGIVPAIQRDKADTEQYMASPEYQAFLRSQGE